MGYGDTILAKISSRNIIACAFVFGYFTFLFYITGMFDLLHNKPPIVFDLEESPVLTMLLGIMSAALVLITQFFFRRATPQ